MNIDYFIPFFSNYGMLILLLAGILGGEEVIISLVFFSAMGLYPLWWVLVFVTIGEFISDIAIFSLGRTNFFEKFKKIERFTKWYKKADDFIMKVSKESIFLTILYSKFLYGTRIFTLVYLASKKIRWLRFLISEFLVVLVWMSITVATGWFAGASISQFISAFKNIELAITLLGVFIILIVVMKKWIQMKLLKKQDQLN